MNWPRLLLCWAHTPLSDNLPSKIICKVRRVYLLSVSHFVICSGLFEQSNLRSLILIISVDELAFEISVCAPTNLSSQLNSDRVLPLFSDAIKFL
jgi:hypothetical protein